MNILVIGNGFDLAHGLPTKYTDFLNFCTMVREIYEDEKLDLHHYKEICLAQCELNEEIEQQLLKVFDSRKDCRDIDNDTGIMHTFTTDYSRTDELYTLIQDNFWIEYFLQCNMYQKENWIDFESEISKVIHSLDDDIHGLSGNYNINDDICSLSNDFLSKKYSEYSHAIRSLIALTDGKIKRISFKDIIDMLLYDLKKLIRALEIYLCDYVEKMEIGKKSPDMDGLEVDFILSFNYTHIFLKLYNVSSRSKQEVDVIFDYIHGEANINNTIDNNNMVLGIDEYLTDDRKNKDIEFIAFKKYYLRIYKGTGSKYKDWINMIREENDIYMERKHDCEIYLDNIEVLDNIKEEMRVKLKQLNENPPRHNLYIFGHSLDVTDKDILRDLILNDNVYTTIFYHDKDAMGQQITNLVKVIGQDELIRRTGGSTKTIKFKPQQDMVPID